MAKSHKSQAALEEVIHNRRVGDWKLGDSLGSGGQGTTFTATRIDSANQGVTRKAAMPGYRPTGQKAVIKLMLPDRFEDGMNLARYEAWLGRQRDGFLREALALSELDSPYIPKVYEAAEQATKAGWGVAWFAQEFLSGHSLAAHVGTQGSMDQNYLLETAHDLLSALAAIHSVHLVHLDLKPDNVMLVPGKACLIDFGLVTTVRHVEGDFVPGTPGFFAPEQLDGVTEPKDFDYAVDIFKLGVTLAIAAGVRLKELWATDPFAEDEVVLAAMKKGPALGRLSPALRGLLTPMLALDPRARPTAATALAAVKDLLPEGSKRASGKKKEPAKEPPRQPARPAERTPSFPAGELFWKPVRKAPDSERVRVKSPEELEVLIDQRTRGSDKNGYIVDATRSGDRAVNVVPLQHTRKSDDAGWGVLIRPVDGTSADVRRTSYRRSNYEGLPAKVAADITWQWIVTGKLPDGFVARVSEPEKPKAPPPPAPKPKPAGATPPPDDDDIPYADRPHVRRAKQLARQRAEAAKAKPAADAAEANVGAEVVVVDRLGLDWSGIVVGLDAQRPGNILIRHGSTRGNSSVRSYPLTQVVRGTPLKQ